MSLKEAPGRRERMGLEQFCTTHWTVVVSAIGKKGGESEAALETLCRIYWYPVYTFIRRRGHPFHEAQDLTQSFFAHLLAGQGLQSLDRNKGRFRSYLVGALKNFLANEWDKAGRLKRGGGQVLSWEGLNPEERFQNEPVENVSAEKLLDRQWARTVAAEALRRLKSETAEGGSEQRFEVLKQFLSGDRGEASYAAAAAKLDLSESAVKSAIHRLRRRFAELFRGEVIQTVSNPEDAEKEIRHLFAALAD